MKTLLSTTALVIALGAPILAFAQETAPAANPEMQQENGMSGFLIGREQADLFASELIGHDVYARRTAVATEAAPLDGVATQGTATDGTAMTSNTGNHSMTTMARADLEQMDNIGQINEIVLSADGKVRAIVVAVGGFLGMGEQDVAVTMDQVTFATDPDDAAEMYIVINTSGEMLKTSPAYNRLSAAVDPARVPAAGDTAVATTGDTATQTTAERTPFSAPEMSRDGYDRMVVTEVTAEMLIGKSVYGVNEDEIGTIDDLILDDAGAITNVIIDFGGFLGMGTSQISLGYDELTILADGGRTDVRVYVDATKDQVQAQPKYQAAVN